MEQTAFMKQGPEKARGVIVLLPGFGDRPKTFQEYGFVREVVEGARGFDVIGADAHFGYYRSRTLLTRLETDVIGPLVKQGYREIWLVGVSMGGHGAVAYARAHPEKIAGLLLFAPYMGPGEVVDEVKREGGLCSWQPPGLYQDTKEGFARENFAWLKQAACVARTPQIWLAVGADDGLLGADRVLADALPRERVLILPGKHGWKVWTPAMRSMAPLAFP